MFNNWIYLFRLRPHYLVMISLAIALAPQPSQFYAALLVAFTYLTAMYGELVNFVYDYGADKQNPRMQKYAHINGKIKLSTLKMASNVFFLMALLSGLALFSIKKDLGLLLLILFALHCAYSYSATPLRLKRYWWGGLTTYTLSNAVVLLISTNILGSELGTAVQLSAILWMGSLSVWTLNSIPDEIYDKKDSIETPAIKFGADNCVKAYLPLALASSTLAAAITIRLAGGLYAGIPFLIPVGISVWSYLRMKKELSVGISKKTLGLAILHHRYNIVFLTLAYFTAQYI